MTVQLLEEHPSEVGGRLGRHIEHDERSKDHAFGIVLPADGLQKVNHRHYGSVFDQGSLGSCTGNAAAQATNCYPIHMKGSHLLKEQDAVDLYELATSLDDIPGQYPPDDTGSSGLAAAKAAQQKGYITSYKHAFSVEEALSALMERPVITGVPWYEGFDSPDEHGLVSIAGQIRGGHEFLIYGFEPGSTIESGIVMALNSWGSSWGDKGHFHFTVNTWRTLLQEQGDTTILIK